LKDCDSNLAASLGEHTRQHHLHGLAPADFSFTVVGTMGGQVTDNLVSL